MLTVSLLLCALVALSRANGTNDTDTCSDGWTSYSTHCLRYVAEKMTWADAELNCQKFNGNLLSVDNVVQEYVLNTLVPSDAIGQGMWLGGSNCQQDDIWLWSDGSPFKFTFWCPTKPNNLNGNQHCLQGDSQEIGRCWNDLECDALMPSVCRTDKVMQH